MVMIQRARSNQKIIEKKVDKRDKGEIVIRWIDILLVPKSAVPNSIAL